MKIRLLKKGEIKEAAAIVGRNYSKTYEQSSALELKDMFGAGAIKPVYFVAEDKGKIIGLAGFVQSWMDYNIYEIFWVNVLPERQNQGVGKTLVARIIAEIKKKKGAYLMLLTANGEKKTPGYYQGNFKFKTLQKFDKNKYHLMVRPLE
jgi:ribosomal protein S18 acetylase RimI-like enzyme